MVPVIELYGSLKLLLTFWFLGVFLFLEILLLLLGAIIIFAYVYFQGINQVSCSVIGA